MAIMNPSRPESEQAVSPRSAPMKFMYASGDRPLDGYVIKRGIGRGGFGEVYFAESDAGKEVAMKLIRRNLDVELRGVRHCLNLKHPNLISLYDIRTDDAGDEWVIMEYVSGPGTGANSLEEIIQNHPAGMPAEEALGWMRGIAAGVGHLHDNGIVHRDLKPGNIFLDGTTIKIGDYGLSKFISCSRRSGQTESVGTVHYMAPEIANGRYGREIDTYALGIILYEMLTGHVPFEGESVGEVLMKHLTAEPDLTVLAEPYQDIVRRLLTKDPEARIQSVGELVDLLPGSAGVGDDPARGGQLGASPSPAEFRTNPLADTGPHLDPSAPISADARQRPIAAGQSAPPKATEEPIYRAMIDGWTGFWQWWHTSGINPAARAAILVLGVIVVVSVGVPIMPAILSMLVIYAIYYCIWSIFILPGVQAQAHRNGQQQARANAVAGGTANAPRENRHARAAGKRQRRLNWRLAVQKQQAAKTWRQRITELTGSMLLAAPLCIGGSALAAGVLHGMTGSAAMPLILWFSIVTTLGSWAVLATNKLTEGRVEDQIPMRGMLLVLGACVGLIAGALNHDGIRVGLPNNDDYGPGLNGSGAQELFDFPTSDGRVELIDGGVLTNVPLSVAYFAFLFLVLRWWRQAEYTREKRLSLWTIVGCMFWAWILHLFWWYPQPSGIAIAGVVAAATQLASPWMPPSKREELARAEVV